MMQQSRRLHRRPWKDIWIGFQVILDWGARYSQWRHSFQCKRTNQPKQQTQRHPHRWTRALRCTVGKRRLYNEIEWVALHPGGRSAVSSPSAELLERRMNHSPLADDTISTGFDIGQVSPNYGSRLHNHLSVQDDVLRAAEDGLPTDFIPRSLKGNQRGLIWFLPRQLEQWLSLYRFDVFIFVVVIRLNFHFFFEYSYEISLKKTRNTPFDKNFVLGREMFRFKCQFANNSQLSIRCLPSRIVYTCEQAAGYRISYYFWTKRVFRKFGRFHFPDNSPDNSLHFRELHKIHAIHFIRVASHSLV